MGVTPNLHPTVQKRLRNIKSDFYASWNRGCERWEVWGKDKWNRPYMVAPIVNAQGKGIYSWDSRVFDYLKKAVWEFNNYERLLYDQTEKDKKAQALMEKHHDDDVMDLARENKRCLQMISREQGYTQGKTKLPYSPGFGGGQ